MAKELSGTIFTSIDIGTTKICVLVAQIINEEYLEIIGIGKSESEGLKKGVVVDVAKTITSIKRAVKEAELMAGITIEAACIGISGGHISSTNSQGMVPIVRGEITNYDITNVIAAAKAVPIPEGQQIIHVLPQYFIIDSRERVLNPQGMHGIRLEVQAHIIMGAVTSVQNLIKCCVAAGISVTDIILEQLASADAVLLPDEKELGVAVLDIGGGTSDLAIYQNNSIRHTMVLPIAGNHFTNDLAVGLRTSLKEAEQIKKDLGVVHISLLDTTKHISVSSMGSNDQRTVYQKDLFNILQPRSHELLWLIKHEIDSKYLRAFMPSGLVITGGGSLLDGISTQAEQLFNMPVRIGCPISSYHLPQSLKSPIYATGYGLLVHLLQQKKSLLCDTAHGPLVKRVYLRMKSWVSDFF